MSARVTSQDRGEAASAGTDAETRPAGSDADWTVLVTDRVSASGLEPLRQDDRFRVEQVDDSASDAFRDALLRAHGLVVRSATRVDRDVLAGAPLLRVVGRAGVGVDNIDLAAATERGIAVINAPAGNTVSAAELTVALILAMVRGVAAADASVRRGEWRRSDFRGVELRGRTLGLVGAGRIGGEVARRCRAFGMHVVAYDPYLGDERAEALGVERAELDEVAARADVLTLHVPLTDATRSLVDADFLARMKEGARLVNVARGGIVDEEALAGALRSGRLAGAALDVYADEPLGPESVLRDAPNLVLTPHLGASTNEAQELVAREIAASVRAALAEDDLSGALNAPSISGEAMRTRAPLFELARRLGRLACALSPGAVRALDVRYQGDSEELLKAISAFVKVGLLEDVLGTDQVNFVSAPHLARQRGIAVGRTRLDRHPDYPEYVELRIAGEQGELRLAGALLGEAHPRIVAVDDYRLDIIPDGTFVVVRNRDVPGVIGSIGTALGERGINIAEYHQARRAPGGDALAAIAVDGDVAAEVRDALIELEEVQSATVVRLG